MSRKSGIEFDLNFAVNAPKGDRVGTKTAKIGKNLTKKTPCPNATKTPKKGQKRVKLLYFAPTLPQTLSPRY